jgi:hypothetical protein
MTDTNPWSDGGAHGAPDSPSDRLPARHRSESRGRRAGKAAAWAAAGAMGATALTGVALAADGSSGSGGSTTDSTPAATAPANPDDSAHPGGGPRGHGGPLGGIGAPGERADVLHGELVVADGDDGATKTVLTQSGAITAVSESSLTVVSADDFSVTWTLNADTKVMTAKGPGAESAVADLEVGDEVVVVGDKTGENAGTASVVRVKPTEAELAEMKENGRADGRGFPGQRSEGMPDKDDGSDSSTEDGATATPSATA